MWFGVHPECGSVFIQSVVRCSSRVWFGGHPQCGSVFIQSVVQWSSRVWFGGNRFAVLTTGLFGYQNWFPSSRELVSSLPFHSLSLSLLCEFPCKRGKRGESAAVAINPVSLRRESEKESE